MAPRQPKSCYIRIMDKYKNIVQGNIISSNCPTTSLQKPNANNAMAMNAKQLESH
jgi:hypothetical protein